MQPFIPKVSAQVMEGPEEENHVLHATSQDLINAIHLKDPKAVAQALEACHYAIQGDGGEDLFSVEEDSE